MISEFWSFLQAEVLRSAGKCVTVHIAKLQLKNNGQWIDGLIYGWIDGWMDG